MPEPIATWNPARGVWEVPQTESLICGHSELYSETWPASGMTRGGSAYALPTSARLMAGSESSSLPLKRIQMVQDAYAAGLLDGEGCLHLTQSGKKRAAWTAKVTINMAVGALPVLRAMHETYGGGLCQSRDQSEKHQEIWLWSLTAKPELKAFLLAVRPHLMVKDRQADVLLNFLAALDAAPKNANGSVAWDQAMRIKGADTKRQITSLNARGAAANALLPTPSVADGTGGPGNSGRDGGLNLRTAATLLPTPTSRDHKGANQRQDDTCLTGALLPTPRATDGSKGGPNQRGSSGDLMLPSAVMLLPTPTGMNAANDPGSLESWEARRDRQLARGINGNGIGTPLGIAVQQLLRDGEPTSPLFDGGSES